MLDKVVGHYTTVGTEEATEFLKLCDQLGLKWHSGGGVYECKPLRKYICVYDDGECTLSQESDTMDLNGVQLKRFTTEFTTEVSISMINVPFGAEYYVSLDRECVITWFKRSDGLILECKAPKTSSTPQYPFWEVSTYPTVRVLGDSFGSFLHAIHELGVEGEDWVEMGR